MNASDKMAIKLTREEVFCWRCGCDLTRRKPSNVWERLLKRLGMSTYACRRCGCKRYHF